MNAWLIIACVFGAVLTLAAIVFGWLAWETRGGPAPYDPEDDALDGQLRALFAADETVPLDVVDGPWNRSEREIHHMTASEFTEMNTAFTGLIAANWPKQT